MCARCLGVSASETGPGLGCRPLVTGENRHGGFSGVTQTPRFPVVAGTTVLLMEAAVCVTSVVQLSDDKGTHSQNCFLF